MRACKIEIDSNEIRFLSLSAGLLLSSEYSADNVVVGSLETMATGRKCCYLPGEMLNLTAMAGNRARIDNFYEQYRTALMNSRGMTFLGKNGAFESWWFYS
jgi:hypothetical protein